ncbi:hypothetical protein WCE37_07775 [Luteimonas sp. MJ250]|uniref:hypothetical protein n=1 Tax=Luteimonas sp. MJ250 TaxID=3129236 RepID=UPI0031B9E655
MIDRRFPRALASAGLCVFVSLLLQPVDASAATTRTINVSATGICDAPLPHFNVNLRRRPVAVQNQGAQPVFVSCTLATDDYGQSTTGAVRVTFKSSGDAASVSCTMVSGTRDAQVFYVGAEQAIPAGGRASVAWQQINKWSTSGTYSFNCHLPPGVAMETVTYTQTDSAGRL